MAIPIQTKEQLELFEYQQFEDKFKPKKTTDDCYTPENIYNAVLDWCCSRYGIDPETVVRPFWPGADFTRTEYPEGCTVIDNPPFSIMSKIITWYMQNGIRFFLFGNGLTAIQHVGKGCTAICTGNNITYAKGASIQTGFLTNLEPPEIVAMSCPELYQILDKINTVNQKVGKKQITKITMPNAVITAAKLNLFSIHNTEFTVKRSEALEIDKLDNYSKGIFGKGLLLSERAAAERAAAKRAAAERAAAERIELSDREKALQKMIGKKTKGDTRQ